MDCHHTGRRRGASVINAGGAGFARAVTSPVEEVSHQTTDSKLNYNIIATCVMSIANVFN